MQKKEKIWARRDDQWTWFDQSWAETSQGIAQDIVGVASTELTQELKFRKETRSSWEITTVKLFC